MMNALKTDWATAELRLRHHQAFSAGPQKRAAKHRLKTLAVIFGIVIARGLLS